MEKKLLSGLCLLLFASASLFAQQDKSKEALVHLSIWDPIGTNGRDAKEYTNTFSFNLLYGKSQSERAFTLSGLASVIEGDAYGLQIAGLTNVIGGDASNLQIAGLVNITGDDVSGLQIAGLVNIAGEDAHAVQISGLTNIAGGDAYGFQAAGFANVAGDDAYGFQVAGLANVAGDDAYGFQVAGLTNVAGDNAYGFQVAGLANVVGDDVYGVQIAGLTNVAGETVYGMQIAGITNRADNVEGMQIAGIYNKAKKVKGVQLGVVNIAESNDYPIGVVNLIKNGEKGLALTFDELQNLTATFRSGGRVLYGIVGLGYNFKSSKPLPVFEGGLGAHIFCTKKFKINAELSQTTGFRFKHVISKNSLRLLPACKITPNFEIFVGPTFNYLHINDSDQYTMFPKHTVWSSSSEKHRLYFGYIGGVHFIF